MKLTIAALVVAVAACIAAAFAVKVAWTARDDAAACEARWLESVERWARLRDRVGRVVDALEADGVRVLGER